MPVALTRRKRLSRWVTGISSHTLPCRSRPAALRRAPPHRFKKMVTRVAWHWTRMSSTHPRVDEDALGAFQTQDLTGFGKPVRSCIP
jgi:hypothetical protein